MGVLLAGTLSLVFLAQVLSFLGLSMRLQLRLSAEADQVRLGSLALEKLAADLRDTPARGLSLLQEPQRLVLALHRSQDLTGDGQVVYAPEVRAYCWNREEEAMQLVDFPPPGVRPLAPAAGAAAGQGAAAGPPFARRRTRPAPDPRWGGLGQRDLAARADPDATERDPVPRGDPAMKACPWETARLLRSLATLYACGVPFDRSLELLARQFSSNFALLHQARRRLQEGHPLSSALRELFPARVRALVRLGEDSGTLDAVLVFLAEEEEARSAQDQRLRSALAYPFFLLVVIVGVLLAAGPAVLRGTGEFVAQFGGAPPAGLTLLRVLAHPLTWLGLAGLGMAVARALRRRPELWLHLPLVDRLWMARALARFSRNLAGALSAGVPLLTALSLGREASSHPRLARELDRWCEELLRGRDLRATLKRAEGLPASFLSTFATGLETGNLERLLPCLAWLYEQEVESATDALAAAAVPVVMLVMGSLVALVIGTLTGPLLKLVATL